LRFRHSSEATRAFRLSEYANSRNPVGIQKTSQRKKGARAGNFGRESRRNSCQRIAEETEEGTGRWTRFGTGHGFDGYQFRAASDPVASLRRGNPVAGRGAARSVPRRLVELQYPRRRCRSSLVVSGAILGKYLLFASICVYFITRHFIRAIPSDDKSLKTLRTNEHIISAKCLRHSSKYSNFNSLCFSFFLCRPLGASSLADGYRLIIIRYLVAI